MGYQSGDELLWMFIVSVVCALFFAFGMGANDVANAFATSVGSKSLTMTQAVIMASIFEMGGSVLMGGFVSSNIQTAIAKTSCYDTDPSLLMTVMTSALLGTGIFMFVATWLSMPVSTSHGIVGGMIGAVLVANGGDCVNFSGLYKIVISWVTSPLLAAACSVVLILSIKFIILRAKDPVKRGFLFFPMFVAFTAFVLAFFTLYEGTPILAFLPLEGWHIVLICFGISAVFCIFSIIVLIPCLKRKINRLDAAAGSAQGSDNPNEVHVDSVAPDVTVMDVATRAPPPDNALTSTATTITRIPSFRATRSKSDIRYRSLSNLEKGSAKGPKPVSENTGKPGSDKPSPETTTAPSDQEGAKDSAEVGAGVSQPATQMSELERMYLDVLEPKEDAEGDAASDFAPDNTSAKPSQTGREQKQEHAEMLFSLLLVVSAILTAFAHGANNVGNIVGPFAAVYIIYSTNAKPTGSDTPWWTLAVGAIGIVLGLVIWGRRVIKTMGEKLTKLTYSKGFSIQVGAVVSLIVAARFGMPVSGTHCQVGSTVGVGLCDGKMAVKWRVFLRIIVMTLLTVPLSGCFSATVCVILLQTIKT